MGGPIAEGGPARSRDSRIRRFANGPIPILSALDGLIIGKKQVIRPATRSLGREHRVDIGSVVPLKQGGLAAIETSLQLSEGVSKDELSAALAALAAA